MEHGFAFQVEMTRQIATATVAVHIALFSLNAAVLTGLFLTTRRAASASDMWRWSIAALAAPVIGFSIPGSDRLIREAVIPIAAGYVGCIWLISAAGAISTLVRIQRGGRAGVIGASVATLVLLGFVLMALFPAMPIAREAARRTQCKNYLKQLGQALTSYHDKHGLLPGTAAGKPPISWRVAVLPFTDNKSVFDEYDTGSDWDSDQNLPVIAKRPPLFGCPSARLPYGSAPATKQNMHNWPTHYVMPTGPETIGARDTGIRMTDIYDQANTLLLVEACGLGIVWTEPRDFDTKSQPIGVNLKGSGDFDSPGLLSSYHLGGAHVLTADGSVRMVSDKIDPRLLERATRNIDLRPTSW